MKSVLIILTLLSASQAFAIEADKWLGVDGTTEGRSAAVDGCTTGNCPQKQKAPLVTQDYQGDLATVDSIMNEGGTHIPPATSKSTH
jgi:hypothetical protein